MGHNQVSLLKLHNFVEKFLWVGTIFTAVETLRVRFLQKNLPCSSGEISLSHDAGRVGQ